MASSIVRGGRRRRVLNEEVRATSQIAIAAVASDRQPEGGEVCRYGEQAHIENHPQITDFVPRRVRTVVAALTAGLVVAASAQALTHYAETIAAPVPGLTVDAVRSRLADGMTAWTSAVILLIAAALARIVFSLRRHRVDDVRGRYLIWKWAAAAAALLSVNSVLQLQEIVGEVAAACGWALTASGVEWWMAPTLLMGGWIAVQTTRDLAESRAALVAMSVALACLLAATVGAISGGVAAPSVWAAALTGALPLAGYAFLLAALMLYARYVVLDVQGLIEHQPERSAAIRAAATTPSANAEKRDQPIEEPAGDEAPKPIAAPATAKRTRTKAADKAPRSQDDQSDRWVDGRGPEAESDGEPDEASQARMSKAQRKRLRKQKARSRAA